MRMADLDPANGVSPDQVAVDETVATVTDQRVWLYAAVEPKTTQFLHVRLIPTRTTAIAKMLLSDLILSDLTERHDVSAAEFLVDGAPLLCAVVTSDPA